MNVITKLCCLVLYWTSSVTVGVLYPPLLPEPGENRLPSSDSEHSILQNLNNFEYTTDTKKQFYQRFLVNETHFNAKNGFVILIIAEQKEIQLDELKKKVWEDYAIRLNALLIYVENRYRGHSMHFMTFPNENLHYLNSEQTLADFAWLIEVVKSQYSGIPSTTKWIAFGSGRSGSLAAWMRLKYPHLIEAAVSASSPLLDIPNYNESFEYLDKAFGSDVTSKLNKARTLLSKALCDDKEKDKLCDKFKMCKVLSINNNEKKNIEYFVWSIFTFLGTLIDKRNYEKKGFYELKDQVMQKMASFSPINGNEIDLLATSISLILNYFWEDDFDSSDFKHRNNCLEIDYTKAVKLYQSTDLDADRVLHLQLNIGIGDRLMFFEQCLEFGQFRTYDTAYLPNERFTLNFYTGLCKDVFGKGFDLISKALDRTEMLYGGVDIEAKRVIFLNRSLDPSSKLSITKSKTNEIVVYNEDGASWAKLLSKKHSDPLISISLFYSHQNNIINKLREWFPSKIEDEIVD